MDVIVKKTETGKGSTEAGFKQVEVLKDHCQLLTRDLLTAISAYNPQGSFDVVSLGIGVNNQYRQLPGAFYGMLEKDYYIIEDKPIPSAFCTHAFKYASHINRLNKPWP